MQVGDDGGNCLAIIPDHQAVRLAAIHEGSASAETWAEFFEPLDEVVVAEVISLIGVAPEPSDAFDGGLIPGFWDSDWPPWPLQQMLKPWLPESIRGMGVVQDSVLNGPFLEIDPAHEDEVIDRLLEARFKYVGDDDVRSALGGV